MDATYTYVQTAVLNAFSETQIHNALKFAYNYANGLTSDTIAYTGLLGDTSFTITDAKEAIAVAILATNILVNSKNSDIKQTRSINQLMTPEIENMLGLTNSENAIESGYTISSNYFPTTNAWSD